MTVMGSSTKFSASSTSTIRSASTLFQPLTKILLKVDILTALVKSEHDKKYYHKVT